MDNAGSQQIKPNAIFWYGDIAMNAIGHIAAEIWKEGIYYPFLQDKKDLTIIDAGSNIGLFSLFAYKYAKKIFAIEPSGIHFSALTTMIEWNEMKNVEARKFALSIKDDTGVLSHYSNTTMYSLYENLAVNNQTGLEKTGDEPVTLKRLDTFFEEEKIDHVDFMKLDVEGVEYEILGSDSFAKVAPKIDQLVVEVHSYSGRHPNQIVDSLKLNGYEVQQIPNDATLIVATRK